MFNRKNLEVAKLADKDRCNGVLVDARYTVAMDGHILGRVSSFESTIDKPFAPFQLDAKAVQSVLTLTNGGSIYVSEENKLHVESKIGPVDLAASENPYPFPNIDVVIPAKDKTKFKIAFNPEFMIRALTLFKGIEQVEFSFTDQDSPLRIDAKTESGQEILALVMPLHLK